MHIKINCLSETYVHNIHVQQYILFNLQLLLISILVLSKYPRFPQILKLSEWNCHMRDKEKNNYIIFSLLSVQNAQRKLGERLKYDSVLY